MFGTEIHTAQTTTNTGARLVIENTPSTRLTKWHLVTVNARVLHGTWEAVQGGRELYVSAHQCEAQNVQVELVSGRVVISLTCAAAGQNFYGEFNIPAGFRTESIMVRFEDGLVCVRVEKQPHVWVKATANAFARLAG